MTTPASFCDVFERLGRDGISYVVIGGVAAALRGCERPVADLDIVVDPSPGEAHRAVRSLSDAGFAPSIPLPPSLLSVLRLFDGSLREIDLFIRYHIPFAELRACSGRARVGRAAVSVASLEHLILMKRLIGRPEDLRDVEALLAAARLRRPRHPGPAPAGGDGE